MQYYGYIQVEKILEINWPTLCVRRASLFIDKNPVEMNIHSFPRSQQSLCIKLYQLPLFIIDFSTEDLSCHCI